MNREFRIGDRIVNDVNPSFVIAEIGHNHQGNMDICKSMFRAAKETGADAVKLQKRDNRALFTREMYDSPYNSENAYAPTYGEHREMLEFNREQYLELKKYAEDLGIIFFSTAFDIPSADLLESIDVPLYKIASGDLTNTPLLKRVASFGKPMIISTGGGTMEDMHRAYDAIMPTNRNLCILHCTSGYPPAFEELNLRVIETMREAFPDIVIGFSSHDSGVAMPLVGYMLGARVFEKHFTLNRAWKGTDQSFSLEPAGLRRVVRDLERARIALGDGIKKTYSSEGAPLSKMVKRLVAARPLKEGAVLAEADIAYKIPVGSKITREALLPYQTDLVVGGVLTRDLEEDEIITLRTVGKAA